MFFSLPVTCELCLTWAITSAGTLWGSSSGSKQYGSAAVSGALSTYKTPQLGPSDFSGDTDDLYW